MALSTIPSLSMSYIVCQVATGLIFCVSIFFIIVPVNLVPSRRMALNYASVPPLCVLTLFLSSCLTIGTVWDGIRGYPDSIEPYSILLLLYGLAYGCISIDESGWWCWLAVCCLFLFAFRCARSDRDEAGVQGKHSKEAFLGGFWHQQCVHHPYKQRCCHFDFDANCLRRLCQT